MINFSKSKIINYPYPILIVDNFFEDKFLNDLLNQFPKYKDFIKYKKVMGNRRFLSNDNPNFFKYIDNNKYWLKFYQEINSKKFYKKILKNLVHQDLQLKKNLSRLKFNKDFHKKNKFIFNLTFYIKEFTKLIPKNKFFNKIKIMIKNTFYEKKKDDCYLRFDLSAASNEYYREPHCDSDGTILAFLIYLEDQKNIGGQGGNFIIHKKNKTIFKSIKPKKNTAVFFLSNKNSIHSVSKITNAIGWRKFIYGGYTSMNKYINLKI